MTKSKRTRKKSKKKIILSANSKLTNLNFKNIISNNSSIFDYDSTFNPFFGGIEGKIQAGWNDHGTITNVGIVEASIDSGDLHHGLYRDKTGRQILYNQAKYVQDSNSNTYCGRVS